jgi:hypothetical protein
MTTSEKWQIYRILRFPESARAPLWVKLDTLALDNAWEAEVLRIVDSILAYEQNPLSAFGSTQVFDPGLKRVNNVEWYEGDQSLELRKKYDSWWLDLAIMVGRDAIIAALPGLDCLSNTGFGFGFS